MNRDKIIYSISVEDIYTVAEEVFDRKPTRREIKFVEEKIGDLIGWYDAIESLLTDFELKSKNVGKKMAL